LPLLLEPSGRVSQETDSRTQRTGFSAKVSRTQRVVRTTRGIRTEGAASSPRLTRAGKNGAARSAALRVPTQVSPGQGLTPPSSDSRRTASAPLPGQCRCQAHSLARLGSVVLPRRSSPRTPSRRKSRSRELWRGGQNPQRPTVNPGKRSFATPTSCAATRRS